MTLAEKLKDSRVKAGLSQKELAKKLDMNLRTYGSYERGERDLSTAILLKICKALSVSSDYLLGREVSISCENNNQTDFYLSQSEQSGIKKYRTLDDYGKKVVDSVLDIEYDRCTSESEAEEELTIKIKHSIYKVSAGHGFDLYDEDQWEQINVSDTPEARKADFALTIQGDSMEPIYSDGEIVLVKEQPSVDIGETGIFVVNGSGYIKQNGGDRLISLNPNYKDIFFSEGDTVSCAGKVIGVV